MMRMIEDKRVTYEKICGREYPLCLTVAAHQKIIDRFGGLSEMVNEMEGEKAVQTAAWLAHTLMEGGAARVKALAWMEGEEAPEIKVPPLDVLVDAMDLKDVNDLGSRLFVAIRVSRGVTVETDDSENNEKNVSTTQE